MLGVPNQVCPVIEIIFLTFGLCEYQLMDEPNGDAPPQKYRWPWFVAAMVLLGIVLAVVFMTVAVKKLQRERDFSAPPTTSAPERK